MWCTHPLAPVLPEGFSLWILFPRDPRPQTWKTIFTCADTYVILALPTCNYLQFGVCMFCASWRALDDTPYLGETDPDFKMWMSESGFFLFSIFRFLCTMVSVNTMTSTCSCITVSTDAFCGVWATASWAVLLVTASAHGVSETSRTVFEPFFFHSIG